MAEFGVVLAVEDKSCAIFSQSRRIKSGHTRTWLPVVCFCVCCLCWSSCSPLPSGSTSRRATVRQRKRKMVLGRRAPPDRSLGRAGLQRPGGTAHRGVPALGATLRRDEGEEMVWVVGCGTTPPICWSTTTCSASRSRCASPTTLPSMTTGTCPASRRASPNSAPRERSTTRSKPPSPVRK